MSLWIVLLLILSSSAPALGQPKVPVEEWTGKTILLSGGRPDDDSSSHSTLSLLRANGNEAYVAIITTGNVGAQDPELSRYELATIRRQEELAALAEIGITEHLDINLGYEFEDEKEVVGKLVRLIRKYQPDVLFAFDSGPTHHRWRKSTHRAAAYLAADATGVAMWRLLLEGQIVHQGLEAYRIPEFLFFDGAEDAIDTWVDITGHAEKKVPGAPSTSVGSAPAGRTTGSRPASGRAEGARGVPTREAHREIGRLYEGFRCYEGSPDNMSR